MENLGKTCSDREGHQAQLGAVFFSWVCLLFWIITTYWQYVQLQAGHRPPTVDDSYQQQHDEHEGGPGATPDGLGREHPMMGEGASDTPLGPSDTSGAVDVTQAPPTGPPS